MSSTQIGLGVIVPSGNSILERDYIRFRRPGVDFFFTRILNSEDTEEQLAGMKDLASTAAEWLTHARFIKAIAFGCTSGSFLKGHGYDQTIVDKMVAASGGLPCVTTAGAVINALTTLGIRRPMVFTPYEEWLSSRSVTFLESHGFAVSGHKWGFDMLSTLGTDDYEPINDWIANSISKDADSVFISCTNFSWLNGIAPLEERLGIPVVTSNSATLWNLFKLAGLDPRTPGLGGLFA